MVRRTSAGWRSVAEVHLWLSSAKDQLTGSSVAVKKIMKPFSTPVLSKRTYRELKLLKHITHENVSCTLGRAPTYSSLAIKIISLSDVFISPLEDMYVILLHSTLLSKAIAKILCYRALGDRSPQTPHLATIREAVYPVLSLPDPGKSETRSLLSHTNSTVARAQIRPLSRSGTSRSGTLFTHISSAHR